MIRRKLFGSLTALMLVAAACGGDDGGTDATGSDTSAEERALETTTTAAATEAAEPGFCGELGEEVDPNGTMRFAYTVGPTSFDPAKSSSSFDAPAMFLTYDRLVHVTPNAEPIPGLATDWEFSEDGTTLTMNLREGVTFHDGEPFNAEAVAANLMRNKAGTAAGDLAALESVDVIDENTVQLNLNAPGGALPLALSDRAGIIASPASLDDPQLDLQPVGTGMYKVTEYQKDARIVYERNEDYWDPNAAGAAGFEFQILTDSNARLNALRTGQLDAAIIDASQVADASDSGLEIVQGLTFAFDHLQFNRSKPFLDQVEVRQAISMAIDREAIVEGVLLGHGTAAVQPFPRGYFARNEDITPDLYQYNPERAREMLQAAGVPEGFTIDTVVPALPRYLGTAEAIKDMLADVGVNLELRPVDPVQTAPIFYVQQDGDALLSVWGGRADPAMTLGLLGLSGPIQNPGGHTTPEFEQLMVAANEPGTPEERAPALHAAVQEYVDQAFNAIVYFPDNLFALQPNVVNFTNWLTAKPEFRCVGVTAAS